jgi:uncharacterized protein YndB with AHSA1/START domain
MSGTTVTRTSDRDITVTRSFAAPPAAVFVAWTQPDIFTRWWMPQSMGAAILACDMDARTGGGYRLTIGFGEHKMDFFGRYLEVVPGARLVWTNEEGPDGAVTTVTFSPQGSGTALVWHDRFPTPEAMAESCGDGDGAFAEQLDQLEAVLG